MRRTAIRIKKGLTTGGDVIREHPCFKCAKYYTKADMMLCTEEPDEADVANGTNNGVIPVLLCKPCIAEHNLKATSVAAAPPGDPLPPTPAEGIPSAMKAHYNAVVQDVNRAQRGEQVPVARMAPDGPEPPAPSSNLPAPGSQANSMPPPPWYPGHPMPNPTMPPPQV
ncbi:hypothetical protein SISSUDRAFT_1067520 [Sistotremastrum suecicum HHB10207 ss-3]|uniref:Stc1 domain-containing protein n=1 Tax=Sistotremastrum suecicum HHB10207 ss-3 TaxID=1314776 RepID=A0A165X0U0_9AGAM|nr:hypothetical protein SISSUDRAFT_1067520 [Sistotremastrum suecicum HHB10207 ss-3]